MGWKEKRRHVKKGEKAFTLCMPVTVKRKAKSEDEHDLTLTRFVYKPHWFVLAQTEGAPIAAAPPWDRARALAALNITE
jgi:hypothetical protein